MLLSPDGSGVLRAVINGLACFSFQNDVLFSAAHMTTSSFSTIENRDKGQACRYCQVISLILANVIVWLSQQYG